jgi:transcription antitermination factor NusG
MNLCEIGHWYAVRTRPNHEAVVFTFLRQKGYEVFLPRSCDSQRTSRKSDGSPLFPGYVFCQIVSGACAAIVTTPGVIRLLGCAGRPEPIPNDEIEAVRRIETAGTSYESCAYLAIGQPVRLISGPLKDLEGTVVRHKSDFRFVVSVCLLQRSVSAEIDASWVCATSPRTRFVSDHPQGVLQPGNAR